MTATDFTSLRAAIAERADRMQRYLRDEQSLAFEYPHLTEAVYSYLHAGGKSLRPGVLMLACGAVGGDEERAVPAAAAVELFHTFTLVHDDIIDHDDLRRGVPTVHVDFAARAQQEFGYDDAHARHYGLTLGILAGDLQQGWAASTLPALALDYGASPELALRLIVDLFRNTQMQLLNGETLDVRLASTPLAEVTDEAILSMLWQKTGSLYAYCGRAGAAIGLNTPDLEHPTVAALADFAGACGVGFQLQDDILGIVGDAQQLGKPVGSDIREGKRTLVITGALPNLSANQRAELDATLGNPAADDAAIARMTAMLREAGGIQHAQTVARRYVDDALQHLEPLPETPQKAHLRAWADYILARDF